MSALASLDKEGAAGAGDFLTPHVAPLLQGGPAKR